MERRQGPRPAGDLVTALGQLSAKQVDVFQKIQAHPEGVQVAQIGKSLGMHPNTVRGHLDELMAAGVITRRVIPARGRGRPSHAYTARVPRTDRASRAMVALVEVLASQLPDDDTSSAHAIGREWAEQFNEGRGAAPATDLDTAEVQTCEILREMGFDPVRRPEATTPKVREIGLHACPFITEQNTRPQPVICALHQGFLDQNVGGIEVKLRPHDRPGECGARLTRLG